MKKLLVLAIALTIMLPLSTEAKSNKPKGYERARGSSITVSEPLGWPVSVSAKVGKLDGSIESLPGMAVIRVKAYKSWYNMFTNIPATTTLTIRGLPSNKQLHIYTNGYRVHTIVTTNNSGTLTLDRPTGRGMQVIIKEHPSTYHIQVGGFINPAGGDCSAIGAWTASTKTCSLSGDVNQTIVIDDPGITLNGNNKFVSAGVGADAINTDQSNVTVKNVRINNSARGVVFSDTLTSIMPSGGIATNIIVTNTIRPYIIEGIPNITASQLNLTGGDTNVRIEDQLDGYNTDGITISDSTLKNAASAAFYANDNDVYATITHTNFVNNIADISGNGAHITLNTTANRGNYWDRNRDCGQSGNECTHSHTPATGYTDAAPWACENGWVSTVNCPTVVVPPVVSTGNYGNCGTIPPAVNDFVEVYNPTATGTPLLETPSSTSRMMKLVPNAWVFQIVDISNPTYLKVKDLGTLPMGITQSTGYIPRSVSCANSARQTEFMTKTELHDSGSSSDISKRKEWIESAIENYATASNQTKNLYGTEGGRDVLLKLHNMTTSVYFKPVMLGIFEYESGNDYNNRVCSHDDLGGVGIGQVTTPFILKGAASNLTEVTRFHYNNAGDKVVDYLAPETAYFDDCYETGGGVLNQKGYYYTNTKQGIFASAKDSIYKLKGAYDSSTTAQATSTKDSSGNVIRISAEEMHWASATFRYNQGSPYKTLYAYYAFKSIGTASTSADVLHFLQTVGYHNVMNCYRETSTSPCQNGTLIGSTDASRIAWIDRVRSVCAGRTQTDCLKRLDDKDVKLFSAPPLYLDTIGENISAGDDFATYASTTLGNKFKKINTSSLILGLASPVELHATDQSGNITGLVSGIERNEIPNSYYHSDTESIVLFFPDANNTYRVIGQTSGDYNLVMIKPTENSILFFTTTSIPIAQGEVHNYSVDWDAIARGENGVTITIDRNGDNIVDTTIHSDWQLTSDEFKQLVGIGNDRKVTICHNVSHNPHTITIDRNALPAHFRHGDMVGDCGELRKEKDVDDNKDDDNNIKKPESKEKKPEPKGDNHEDAREKDNNNRTKGKKK